MEPIEDVIERYSGLCRSVLDYSLVMKRMMQASKQPGFSTDSWSELAALVDTQAFERVGNFKEVQGWDGYLAFLMGWAPHAEWDCSFKRITEHDRTVFLELEERTRMGERSSIVNSTSVYEFNADGKIAHLDIYLQMPLSDLAGMMDFAENSAN